MNLHNHDHEKSPHTASEWDERYAESERIWSGEVNGLLVDELTGQAPGTALDVGCGEGADAIWLTQQGWQVTALDISATAIERARSAAAERDLSIEWIAAGLQESPLSTYDLVSVFYPALLKGQGHEAALMSAVEPGGELLFVHHADIDREHALERGFDPFDYVQPEDMAAALADAGWEIAVDEKRDRSISGGAGAHHHVDRVVRARRPD